MSSDDYICIYEISWDAVWFAIFCILEAHLCKSSGNFSYSSVFETGFQVYVVQEIQTSSRTNRKTGIKL